MVGRYFTGGKRTLPETACLLEGSVRKGETEMKSRCYAPIGNVAMVQSPPEQRVVQLLLVLGGNTFEN